MFTLWGLYVALDVRPKSLWSAFAPLRFKWRHLILSLTQSQDVSCTFFYLWSCLNCKWVFFSRDFISLNVNAYLRMPRGDSAKNFKECRWLLRNCSKCVWPVLKAPKHFPCTNTEFQLHQHAYVNTFVCLFVCYLVNDKQTKFIVIRQKDLKYIQNNITLHWVLNLVQEGWNPIYQAVALIQKKIKIYFP